MNIARDLVRRGLSTYALDATEWARSGLAPLMDIAFELTSDPGELHELLDVCSRSISEFVDATLAFIAAQIEAERDELTRGTHAERRETVARTPGGRADPWAGPRPGWATR